MKCLKNLQRGFTTTAILVSAFLSGMFIHKGIEDIFGPETHTFFKHVLTNTKEVGALLPCTKYVGTEITKHIRKYNGKKIRILEVGSGTGILTRYIVENAKVKNDYHIDLVELNTDFCTVLHERFGNDTNVHIHAINILDWHVDEPYDIIISTLPFNIFSEGFIKNIFDKYQNMLTKNGHMSYVELGFFRHIGPLFMTGERKQEQLRKINLVHGIRDKYLDETVLIKRNIPHIYVHHLQF